MKKSRLTIEDKQEVLLEVLRANNTKDYAIFGVEREVVWPLVKKGLIHKDTYRFTGGAKLTIKGRENA